MGQIVSSAAKPKRCNLNQLSQVPTPADGEYILVSSDNTMNATGQGNFDCYIVGDGSTTATELELKSVDGNTTVKTITQSFTDAQKEQARTNIGAVDITEVEDIIDDFSEKVEGENKFIPGQSGFYDQRGVWRTYFVHTFFDVSQGDVFRLYNWQTSSGVTYYHPVAQATICAFDENNAAVYDKGATNVSSYTVPEGITRICFGINNAIVKNPCVTLNQETPPAVETPYVAPKNVVITDSTLTDKELPANSKAVGNALALKMDISDFVVSPNDIKQTPFLEDFRFCEILPNKVVSSVTTIEGKNYIVWNNSVQSWYTIAINIRSYKDLLLVSDILPQSTITNFLTVGIDTGETDIEYVAMIHSDGSFTLSPNAYVFDDEKMAITLSALYGTYGYKGNIVLYIKMPTTYKINWLASGMQLEGYDWMKIGSYAKSALKKELKTGNVKIVLPSKVYAVVGHEMNLYKDSFLLCDDADRYGLISSFGSLTTSHKGQNECFSFTPTQVNNGIDCTISVYDKVTLERIATKTFKMFVKAASQPSKKVIFIGDSLTDRCIYPAEICQVLGGGNLISLGTRHDTLTYQGSDGVVSVDMDNEGRGGWSATDYVKKSSLSDVPNAFWNPNANDGEGGFDFAYYMSTNNFDSVDCVVIALGTNDVGKPMLNADFDTIISSFRTMVDSIHSYNSSIKIIVSLTPHGAEPDGWAASTHSDQSTIYNYLQFTLVEKLIEEFEADVNVFLAPTYLNIDHHNDYPTTEVAISARNPKVVKRQRNNVHFSVDSTTPVSQCWGYLKMADAIWYTMMAAFAN